MEVPQIKLNDVSNNSYALNQINVERKNFDAFKRSLDIFGATLGIIMLFPIFIIISIFIKFEDPFGPIFFKQVRVGKNGQRFNMYKFRSMIVDAEKRLDGLLAKNEVSGAMFKMKHDPRITRIGKFIRKTSLDELPQLWNVLKGDMSLVGPRPPLPREVELYSEYEYQRLLVIPGCTGLWQVSGRNNLGFNQMVDLDLEYIKKRSILLDLIIILKTFREIVASKDAF